MQQFLAIFITCTMFFKRESFAQQPSEGRHMWQVMCMRHSGLGIQNSMLCTVILSTTLLLPSPANRPRVCPSGATRACLTGRQCLTTSLPVSKMYILYLSAKEHSDVSQRLPVKACMWQQIH
ncbi:TPA: hypothetical protein ACH3X1_016835 [Trebouxia sp. C0004]